MGDRNGWTGTAIQAAPQLLELVRHLRPTVHVPSIASIDDAFLAHHAVSAIIWDVDGTLTPDKGRSVASDVRAVLNALGRSVRQAILSNCDDDRLIELGTLFADMPVLKGYRLENGQVALRRLHEGREEWSAREEGRRQTMSRPSGRVRSIRKPNADLVDLAVRSLGADRNGVLMVGDQYFTDIAGANMAGIRSVKVATLAPASFPLAVQVFQRVERIVYRILYGSE
jgi:predicted HAD superfamily phosphohydrolase YqeG